MNRFKRYYKASTMILGVVVALATLNGLCSGDYPVGIGITVSLVAALPLVPILLGGGLDRNRRLAIGVSLLLAIGFSALLGLVFVEFVQTKGLEGPNGEGAPGAIIVAMVFFALVFLCPWLLTALRGLRLWNLRIRDEREQMRG